MVIVMPVVAKNRNRKPPDVPSFTLGGLGNVVLPVTDHVAEGVDKLNAVPADADWHHPQPSEPIEAE